MRCMCVTDQQHGLFTEQLLLQHLQVSLLLFQLTSDVLLSITVKQSLKLVIRSRDTMSIFTSCVCLIFGCATVKLIPNNNPEYTKIYSVVVFPHSFTFIHILFGCVLTM